MQRLISDQPSFINEYMSQILRQLIRNHPLLGYKKDSHLTVFFHSINQIVLSFLFKPSYSSLCFLGLPTLIFSKFISFHLIEGYASKL